MDKDQHAGQGGSYEMIDGVRVLVQRTDDGRQKTEVLLPQSGDLLIKPALEAPAEAADLPAPKHEHTKGE